jgi:Sulfotransferase domain
VIRTAVGGECVRIIGAGLGRTGTHSLKLALERLLDAPCYHMAEVFEHLDHVPTWHAAIRGEQVDWQPVLAGYSAIVDWPGAAVWRQLAAAHPAAPVLLSTRRDAATWLKSARATILDNGPDNKMADDPGLPGFVPMVRDMFAAFEPNWRDDDAAMAAYDRHNAAVRREVPAQQLVEWQPGDGWEPLCSALGIAVPDEEFPHVNTTEEFRFRREERSTAEPAQS